MAVQLTDEEIYLDRKSAAISVPEGEPAVVVYGHYLFSVEHLRVTHPDRLEDVCPIYGQIYISNEANPRVTLYNRSREDAETLYIGDTHRNLLSLNYDDIAAHPVLAGFPTCLTIQLFEKRTNLDQDTQIADIEWEFDEFADWLDNMKFVLELEEDSGFSFSVTYAMIYPGIWAEVEFCINRDIYAEANKKRKLPTSSIEICGIIQASRIKEESITALRLYSKESNAPGKVDVGSPVDLDRKAVIVPVASGGVLSIDYEFYCPPTPSTEELVAQGRVPFYIKSLKSLIFVANQTLKHTKHVENGLFSVSITFIPFISKDTIYDTNIDPSYADT